MGLLDFLAPLDDVLNGDKPGQGFIDNAEVDFKQVVITNIREAGFSVHFKGGSVTNTGPYPAVIDLGDMRIKWDGVKIATVTDLPRFKVEGNVGISGWEPSAKVVIDDKEVFAEFLGVLLRENEFTWIVETETLCLKPITDLAPIFRNLRLSNKPVTFDAFQNLPGIELHEFDLLRQSLRGGIDFNATVQVPSTSQIAFSFGAVDFNLFTQEPQKNMLIYIGSVRTERLDFPAKSTSRLQFTGHIDKGMSKDDLRVAGALIANYLSGKDHAVVIKDASITPPLTWVTPVLEEWSLDITIPGLKDKVVISVEFPETLTIMQEPGDPGLVVLPSHAVITYMNPFTFPFDILSACVNLAINYEGEFVANVQLPDSAVRTKVKSYRKKPGQLQIDFNTQALQDVNFASAFKLMKDSKTWGTSVALSGVAVIVIQTPIGNMPITDLEFKCDAAVKASLT